MSDKTELPEEFKICEVIVNDVMAQVCDDRAKTHTVARAHFLAGYQLLAMVGYRPEDLELLVCELEHCMQFEPETSDAEH